MLSESVEAGGDADDGDEQDHDRRLWSPCSGPSHPGDRCIDKLSDGHTVSVAPDTSARAPMPVWLSAERHFGAVRSQINCDPTGRDS